jgi:catechol 2,3-dioxygenase-like lactoylglutathione lyase family enzyme
MRYLVDDVDRAVDFYTTHLGFTLGHHAAPAFADVMRGPLRLLLSGPTSSGARAIPDGSTRVRGGWNRIHLIVDDITAEVARARVAGLSFRNNMTRIKPGSVVLFHDTYSSTVDLVYQFIPVLKANGYRLVTVSEMLGPRAPGSSYGGRDNGPPINDITDIPAAKIPTLPNTPSPKPMPNLPITDIPNQNPGGPQ